MGLNNKKIDAEGFSSVCSKHRQIGMVQGRERELGLEDYRTSYEGEEGKDETNIILKTERLE